MSAADTITTAAERARPAPDQALEHQREVALARHRRARARNVRFALVSAAIFAGVLAFGFYKGVPILLGTAGPTADSGDPFAASRVGRVQTWNEREGCLQYKFDNTTGAMTNKSSVPCYSVATGSRRPTSAAGLGDVHRVAPSDGPSMPKTQSRLEEISKAFKR